MEKMSFIQWFIRLVRRDMKEFEAEETKEETRKLILKNERKEK